MNYEEYKKMQEARAKETSELLYSKPVFTLAGFDVYPLTPTGMSLLNKWGFSMEKYDERLNAFISMIDSDKNVESKKSEKTERMNVMSILWKSFDLLRDVAIQILALSVQSIDGIEAMTKKEVDAEIKGIIARLTYEEYNEFQANYNKLLPKALRVADTTDEEKKKQ